MNLPTTNALDAALPAAAASATPTAVAPAIAPASQPAVAAAADAPARPAADGSNAPAADAAQGQAGAFQALLASLGLLPTIDAAPQEADATGDDTSAEPATTADTTAAPVAAVGDAAVQPAAELTPAWRNDAAMLMASLPMTAVAPVGLPAAAATPDAQAAAASGDRTAAGMSAIGGLAGMPAAEALSRNGRLATQATPGAAQAAGTALPQGHAAALAGAHPAASADAGASVAAGAGRAEGAAAAASTAALREPAPASPAERSAPAQPLRRDEVAALVTTPGTDTGAAPVHATESASAVASTARAVPAHGPALLQALGERLQVQIAQRSEHAVIRLDPQAMGSVEIVLRHEAGALQVQLSASHPDVQRQLQSISDALRQDLSQRQYTDVSVNVAAQPGDADGRRRQGGQPQAEERPGRALAEAERGASGSPFSMASSLE